MSYQHKIARACWFLSCVRKVANNHGVPISSALLHICKPRGPRYFLCARAILDFTGEISNHDFSIQRVRLRLQLILGVLAIPVVTQTEHAKKPQLSSDTRVGSAQKWHARRILLTCGPLMPPANSTVQRGWEGLAYPLKCAQKSSFHAHKMFVYLGLLRASHSLTFRVPSTCVCSMHCTKSYEFRP